MYIKTVLTLRQAQFKQTGGKKNFDKQPHHSEVDYSWTKFNVTSKCDIDHQTRTMLG